MPFQFEDTNGFQVTWWGEQTRGIDGHNGYDWFMPEGTPLLAVADGVVVAAGIDGPFQCPPLNRTVDDQQFVLFDHTAPDGQRFRSVYKHLSRISVQPRQRVVSGQEIGLSGNTGCSTGPHLHFEVYRLTGTNNGRPSRIDLFGWEGETKDPWLQHPDGAGSVWLWKEGQAPPIFRESSLRPNPNPNDNATVTITVIRWMGWKDSEHANNEFVQLEVDPRFTSRDSLDLSGFRLRNNRGDVYEFPRGVVIRRDTPLRVFTGPGSDSNSDLFWGRSAGVWDNMGDCARLVRPTGIIMYRLNYGRESCN